MQISLVYDGSKAQSKTKSSFLDFGQIKFWSCTKVRLLVYYEL